MEVPINKVVIFATGSSCYRELLKPNLDDDGFLVAAPGRDIWAPFLIQPL